ncbi:MAG: SpoIIE family protein phosphatase [Candidatus Riflebacteria bacterium]|nr:SpoIIE family protein phosphatase [Candidatus Riflebacteria bacterium]
MPVTAFICLAAMAFHLCLSLLVLWRAPHKSANRLFSLLLGLFFFWSLGEFLLIYSGPRPIFYRLLFTPVILLPYVFALFTAHFPRRIPDALILVEGSRQWLFFLPTAVLLTLLWSNYLILFCEPISSCFIVSFGRFEFLAKGIAVGYLLIAMKTLSTAFRNVDSSLQEQRLRYTFAGLMLPAAAGSIYVALGRFFLDVPGTIYTFGIFPGLGLIMAALIGYAMLRYRLLDIDMIFGIGLVYTLLTAALAGGMELTQNLMQNLFDANNTLAMVVSTLIIAAAFSPLKDLIVRFVDYIFGKRTFDTTFVMGHLLKQMRAAREPEEVLRRLLAETRTVLDFSAAAIVMKSGLMATLPVTTVPLPPLPSGWLPLDEIDAFIEASQEVPNFDVRPFQAWRDCNFRLVFPITSEKRPEHGAPILTTQQNQLMTGMSPEGALSKSEIDIERETLGALFLAPKTNSLPYTPEERGMIGSICQEIPPILDTIDMIKTLIERDRDSRDLQWTTEMYRRIRADESRQKFGGREVRLFSSLAPCIKGDLIDIMESADGSGFLAVCDAFHEGIQAAITLQTIYAALRAAAEGRRIDAVHAVLADFNSPPLRSAVTLLERSSDDKWYISNSGNPAPMLFQPEKHSVILTETGKPLGMEGRIPVARLPFACSPGDILLCCTNGLAKVFGDETGVGLQAFVTSRAKLDIDGLNDALHDVLSTLPGRLSFPDDITYVLLGGPQIS